jgi:hypothetical protein
MGKGMWNTEPWCGQQNFLKPKFLVVTAVKRNGMNSDPRQFLKKASSGTVFWVFLLRIYTGHFDVFKPSESIKVKLFIYIYIKIYCTEIRCSTCGVTKLLLQPIYNIITSCIHVGNSKTDWCFSSEKESQWRKNTAADRWGVTAGDALSVCVYISYTACGDQVKCSSLFHEQEG